MTYTNTSVFRIIFESRENYRVMTSDQKLFPAELAGKIRTHCELWPAVGDWVRGTLQPGNWVQIVEVLPRKSVLARKDPGRNSLQVLAANVDTMFVVTSANHDMSLNRLDRYIAIAISGNVKPVIVINKMELAEFPDVLLAEAGLRFPQVPVLGVSVHENWNLGQLKEHAKEGVTVAFVGSSGVGKSSLTNVLLGEERIFTQEIRESDGRGRHTTTHRELHVTPEGAVIIDTPGIRQVGLTEETALDSVFSDVESLASTCRFSDCQHRTEPGCAILAALENGELNGPRWENYQKLQREIEYERRKSSKALQSQEKKRWAKISKAIRAHYKIRGRE